MKPDKTASQISLICSGIVAVIIILLPFHAFLTVWLSSVVGHYTLLRLWKEILLVPVSAGVIYLVARDSRLRKQLFGDWLSRLIGIYSFLLLVTGFIALFYHDVTAKALAYGELVDLRFLFFFLMVMVIAAGSQRLSKKWTKLLLVPSAIVIFFGLLQYWLLPYDFLKHFGYGATTINPYETINHNLSYLRIESTLRGANPLGAYLVLIVSACATLLLASKKKLKYLMLLAGGLVALALSFSRSAWIGAAASLAIVAWVPLKSDRLRRRLLIAAGVLVVLVCAAGLLLRNTTTFQDDILHTDNQSQASESSNQGHSAAFKAGVHDIVHQPLGGGVGTAGPASIYNNHPGRIAENYFLQIGQEAGVVGMGLFIAINIMVGLKLWRQRREPLALALFASLVGLSFVNMLSHAWTDDTLAYIWWGLAGISLSPVILNHKGNNSAKKNKATA